MYMASMTGKNQNTMNEQEELVKSLLELKAKVLEMRAEQEKLIRLLDNVVHDSHLRSTLTMVESDLDLRTLLNMTRYK